MSLKKGNNNVQPEKMSGGCTGTTVGVRLEKYREVPAAQSQVVEIKVVVVRSQRRFRTAVHIQMCMLLLKQEVISAASQKE